MDLRKVFEQVMAQTVNMALATSVEDKPNVRVVTFGYSPSAPDTLYFTSFKGNNKTKEFDKNESVACMPLPENPDVHAQVRIFGKVQKSKLSVPEVISFIRGKAPSDADTIEQGRDMMEAYEINFKEAFVTMGMSDAQTVQF